MTQHRTPGLIIAALLLTATAATLVAQQLQWRAVPSEGSWRLAAAEVARDADPETDAFLVDPPWDSRPRVHLGDLPYVAATDVTWFDLDPYQRAWLLTETDRLDHALRRLPAPWTVDRATPTGDVTVLALTRGEDTTRWDALRALEQATVTRVYANRSEVCDRFSRGERPAWRCKRRDPFLYVGETLQLVTNEPHRCLWAMPIDEGGELRIAWEGVPLQGTLSGRFGQTFDAVRSSRGAPIEFIVRADDELIWEATLGHHDEGFLPFEVALPPGKDTGRLTFSVHSDDQLDRMFCFVARIH
ncbi:MAG: hypothetical protein CMH57_06910 [Myxococcales bacterium]|nr:hypothetical protein [Myxococcales bacterium]